MKEVFAKTILLCQESLEEMTEKIDGVVYAKALSAHRFQTGKNTFDQIDSIVRLINKKNELINLRILAEDTLSKTDAISAGILKRHYWKGMSHGEIIEMLGIPERTYYRKLEKAVKLFAARLTSEGFDDAWFRDVYFGQRWIKDLYQRTERKEAAKQKAAKTSAQTKPQLH